ncbi:YeeE/YedE family protein [Thermoleophilia bacterium SCSIO 60948]|nr:YeeE/YedE family protein [Thermoleophilia bacterium SCSIO 60948]
MTAAALGLGLGLAFGWLMASGRVCFNSAVREATLERQPHLLRIFGLMLGFSLLVLAALHALGVAPLDAAIAAGTPPLAVSGQLLGGVVFGAGMALAGGCITGILWRTGAGSIATAIAIAGFAAGELLARGPLADAVASLAGDSRTGGLAELTGVDYAVLAPLVGLAILGVLLGRSRDGLRLGAALGLVAALAWVVADLAGYGYGLGFAGSAQGTLDAIETGGALPFQLWLAIGVLAAGALVIRGPLRMPDGARAGRALAGGLAMGLGATLAGACNIGHAVTGLGLLSVGSLVATLAMAAGVVAVATFMRSRPQLRGTERPVSA